MDATRGAVMSLDDQRCGRAEQGQDHAIELLLVDLCGVLYDGTAWHRWLLQLLARMGLHAQLPSFCRVWESEYLCEVNRGRIEYWQALGAFLRSIGLSRGQIDEILAAGHARRAMLEDDIRPFPGVAGVLAELANRRVDLVAISHGPWTGAQLRQRLDRLQLAASFDHVLSSLELGYGSSAERVFQAALRRLGQRPNRAAYVGHDPLSLAGAHRAGLTSIALNYSPGTFADVYLEHLHDLLALVPQRPPQLLAG